MAGGVCLVKFRVKSCLMQWSVQLCLCIGVIERTLCKELQRVFSGNLICTFSVHSITVTHNVLLSEHTVTVQFVMYVQCAQHYCNT
jgi:hypothetical protein